MRYYVVSDVHGFFTQMKTALSERGFFDDKDPHKLILCGDMLDRGEETLETQNFMLDLNRSESLIFVRGNHEDLMLEMLKRFNDYRFQIAIGISHHNSNGTFDSALKLSGMSFNDALHNPKEFVDKAMQSDFVSKLIPSSVNYFETEHYIFVHGWIPCFSDSELPAWRNNARHYRFNKNWRKSTITDWENARWMNGMDMAERYGIIEQDKTIVCGHWNASYGHSKFEQKCSEFEDDADFSPYYGNGIIAIDACTAHSGLVNCIVIDD